MCRGISDIRRRGDECVVALDPAVRGEDEDAEAEPRPPRILGDRLPVGLDDVAEAIGVVAPQKLSRSEPTQCSWTLPARASISSCPRASRVAVMATPARAVIARSSSGGEDLSAVLRPELGDQAPAPVGVGLVPEPDAPSANSATLRDEMSANARVTAIGHLRPSSGCFAVNGPAGGRPSIPSRLTAAGSPSRAMEPDQTPRQPRSVGRPDRAGAETAGELTRFWRIRGGLRQLELSLDANVSTKHLSFVETGRSNPSRQLLVHLAQHLDLPIAERNRLLLAGGYAPPCAGAAFTVIATLGSPLDVTAASLAIETFLPMDPESAARLAELRASRSA